MDFGIQCIECAKEYALYGLFRSYGVLADDNDNTTTCNREGCSFTRLYRACFCLVHVIFPTVAPQVRFFRTG